MVYYHKMWSLMKDKNVTQRELANGTGVSTATLTKMRKGEYVSLEVIDKIRMFLNCDFEDLITSTPPNDTTIIAIRNVSNYDALNDIVRNSLQEYMDSAKLKVIDVSRQTGLSVNTVKSFLRGNSISAYSFVKLCKLGDRFVAIIFQDNQFLKI